MNLNYLEKKFGAVSILMFCCFIYNKIEILLWDYNWTVEVYSYDYSKLDVFIRKSVLNIWNS